MATVEEVKAKLVALKDAVTKVDTDLDSVRELVADLKEQVAAGSVVSQAQLDELDAAVTDIQSSLAGVTTEVEGIS